MNGTGFTGLGYLLENASAIRSIMGTITIEISKFNMIRDGSVSSCFVRTWGRHGSKVQHYIEKIRGVGISPVIVSG